MAKVLTLISKSGKQSYEVHMLDPGEFFPNFGGSRHGLQVRKTASIITRFRDKASGTLQDVEYNIYDPTFWEWISRLINSDLMTATYEEEQPKTG